MTVTERSGGGPIRRFNSRAFYWVADRLTDPRLPNALATSVWLIGRSIEVARSMGERNRFVRGLFAWVGFRSLGVEADRPERLAGKSKAYTFHVADLAVKGILAHSHLPMKFITFAGFTLSTISFVALVALSLTWILAGVPFAGFGTIVALTVGLRVPRFHDRGPR